MSSPRKKKSNQASVLTRFIKQKRHNILAEPGPLDIVIVLDGLKPNYNIGKIFRTAYALGIRKIHLIGIDFFDPAPAKGSFRYVPAVFDDDFESCQKNLIDQEYTVFIFTPGDGKSLQEVQLPEKSAFVFGHEEFGVSFSVDDHPELHPVHIKQLGKVESLNVSVAASIAMYEYARQYSLKK